jgi:predicted cupin superfamily sugar epimerase
MDDQIQKIVEKLKLQKLWDQDFIKEGYCSDVMISTHENQKSRPLFNWAYYLIPEGEIFPLHKLLSDESWQYCLGGPLDLFLIENGEIKTIRIGPDIFNDQHLYYVVKRNTWFAGSPVKGSKFTLITHCVSPGWDPEDDIAGFYEDMIKLAPNHSDFIKKYSWPNNRKTYISHETYKDDSWKQ